MIVQSGRQPSVLQKLCQLPFQYFSHPRLIRVLFPSLISACYNNSPNKVILQQEMSCVMLATFIQVRACSAAAVLPQRFKTSPVLPVPFCRIVLQMRRILTTRGSRQVSRCLSGRMCSLSPFMFNIFFKSLFYGVDTQHLIVKWFISAHFVSVWCLRCKIAPRMFNFFDGGFRVLM